MALDMTTALTIRAKVDGLQQLTGLNKGLQGVSKQSNATATAMGRLKGAAAGAMGALRGLLPVLGVGAMAKFAKDNIDAADAMSKMSQRTGVGAPMLDKFRKVAELSDTSIEGLGKGFKTLASNMYDAQTKGTGPAADAFSKLGVAITDSNGKLRESDQVMLDIADKFQQMADGPEKAALAADLFGAKIGDELIPLLNSGGDAVRNMGTSLTQDFADKAAAFNDRLETMQEKLGDLGLRLTETLMPALETLVGIMESIGSVFSTLPQPVQDIALAFTAVAIPVAALAIPLGGLVTVFGAIGTALASLGPLLAGIPALIAGWAGAIGPLVAALGTLGNILIGVFSGPVGWVALAAAAGVAIYAFRDQIGAALKAIGEFFVNAFKAIGDLLKAAAQAYLDFYVKPVLEFAKNAVQGILDLFGKIPEAIKAPFINTANAIKSIFGGILNFLVGTLNTWIQRVNYAISVANRLPGVSISNIPTASMPGFAAGGVVTNPTVAMVGEKEQEYIIPESKMARASANYLAGMRGGAVIPAFANGGVVGGGGGMGSGNTTVQINTGPVLQQDGQRYVTISDLENALKDFGTAVFSNARTPGGRRYQGVRA